MLKLELTDLCYSLVEFEYNNFELGIVEGVI